MKTCQPHQRALIQPGFHKSHCQVSPGSKWRQEALWPLEQVRTGGSGWDPERAASQGAWLEGACSAHRGMGLDPAELQRHAAGVSRTLSACYCRKKMPKCLVINNSRVFEALSTFTWKDVCKTFLCCPQEALR